MKLRGETSTTVYSAADVQKLSGYFLAGPVAIGQGVMVLN